MIDGSPVRLTDEREHKLPKWAQDQMRRIRAKMYESERHVDRLQRENAKNNTDIFLVDEESELDTHLDPSAMDAALPLGGLIRWDMGSPSLHDRVHVRKELVDYVGERLVIKAGRRLVVEIKDGNELHIKLEDR